MHNEPDMTPAEFESKRTKYAKAITDAITFETYLKRPLPKLGGIPVIGSGCKAAHESIRAAARANHCCEITIRRAIEIGMQCAGQVWCYATPRFLSLLARGEVLNLHAAICVERDESIARRKKEAKAA